MKLKFYEQCMTFTKMVIRGLRQSGQIITVRSTIWRIFDFFWMLHIMDYEDREDFNNPLLISFSVVAVLFCVSGMIMLFQGGASKRMRLLSSFKKMKP